MQHIPQPIVVQFVHPAPEDLKTFGNGLKPWNCGKHKRNFLVSAGEAISVKGSCPQRFEKISFWGEWEPEAKIVQNYKNVLPYKPHRLICPLFPLSVPFQGKAGCCANTDPFVFGNNFKYSNCRQYTNKGKSKTLLQSLPTGSIILFGSCLNENGVDVFVLDTVFLVENSKKFNSKQYSSLKQFIGVDYPLFEAATLKPLDMGTNPSRDFTLYQGQNYEEKKCYSFVPCDVNGNPFARISLTKKIIPELSVKLETFKVLKKTKKEYLDPQNVWNKIADYVLSQGFSLGVRFDNVAQNVRTI